MLTYDMHAHDLNCTAQLLGRDASDNSRRVEDASRAVGQLQNLPGIQTMLAVWLVGVIANDAISLVRAVG